MLQISAYGMDWKFREPLRISRGVEYSTPVIQVRLRDAHGRVGIGEASGVDYHGETVASMIAEIEDCRARIESGVTREELLSVLPAGGARNALDCAMWDLEVQQGRPSPLDEVSLPLTTAFTIGMRAPADYERAAAAVRDYPLLKIKVDDRDPVEALEAVRRGSPEARIIVDPNQSWPVPLLKELAPRLAELNVVLIEQPVAIGSEEGLKGWRSPVPLAADELVNTRADLPKARGCFDVISIKLDKAGGLTEGLALAEAARAEGFGLMVGCMAGSSLQMAAALAVASRCDFVDLDGPLLQAEDSKPGLVYGPGQILAVPPGAWGTRRDAAAAA
jgi:L-Ala-D/L-Glu epimerase